MKLKASVLLSSAVMALTLVGCGSKNDVPACGSSEVQDELQKAIKKFADEQKVQAKIEFKDFVVENKNQDQRKVVCKATANGYYGQNNLKDEEFKYTAQYTEDNKLLVKPKF